MIRYIRGRIMIVDLEGLREAACECYTAVREQYEHLFGSNRTG